MTVEDVPGMFRPELFHPLTVHFPIGLLVFGAFVISAAVLARGRAGWQWVRNAGRLALLVGTVGAWIAVWTGDIADSVVARTLCDPPVAELHEQLGWLVAIVFTVLVIVELVALPRLGTGGRRLVGDGFVVLGLLGGVALLAYVGHLGAELVYQQAAAVYVPGEQCVGFGD